MRILIQGMNYAPEVTGIAPYTAGLAEHLTENGHEVSVATTFPHYPQWAVQPPYDGHWRAIERLNGVDVRRSRVLLPKRHSTTGRIGYDSSLVAGTLLNSLPGQRPDLVLCISPPIQLGLTAAVLARTWRVPLVLLVQDLPLDAALAVGMLRRGPAVRLGRWLENLTYRLADRIIVISNGFRTSLLQNGVCASKIKLIPNWANVDQIRPTEPDTKTRALLGAQPDDFLIVHTGNMGEKQGLLHAIQAIEALPSESRVRLALVGDGSEREMLQGYVTERGLGSIRFLPLQPSDVFARILAAADALLLNQRANVIDSVAPSKLLSYMAAGRPVIAAVHARSEAAEVIRAARCGEVVAPEDPATLAAALQRIAGQADVRRDLGASGRRYVEAHYARDRVLARYESFLTGLATRQ